MDTAATQTVEHALTVEPEKMGKAAEPHIAIQVMEGVTFAAILIVFSWMYVAVALAYVGA